MSFKEIQTIAPARFDPYNGTLNYFCAISEAGDYVAYAVLGYAWSGSVYLGKFGATELQFNELDQIALGCLCQPVFLDDRTLVCGSSRDIVLFDVSAGTLNQLGVLQGHTEPVIGVAAHGDWLASCSADRTVRVWSVATREEIHCWRPDATPPTQCTQSACFSHSGRWLASGGRTRSVTIRDTTRRFARHTAWTLSADVFAVCFSPDDSMLAVGAGPGDSALYSVDAFEPLRVLTGAHAVHCVAWLGNDAAAALVGGTDRGELVVWSTSTGRVTSQQKAHEKRVRTLSFTSSFRTLMTGSDDKTARVFDAYSLAVASATAALYRASLLVFLAFRSSRADGYLLQRLAEALVGSDVLAAAALSDEQRNRIAMAARVSFRVRARRVTKFEILEDYHERMHWLRDVAPHYTFKQLASLGPK